MSRARALRVLALLAAAVLGAARARAAGSPADTTLEGYVRSMADSTDRYFGLTAQPADTTGLDSLRAYFEAHPKARPGRRNRPSFSPVIGFSRVLGSAPGAGVSIGRSLGAGSLDGSAQWAMGPDQWFGAGEYEWRRTDATESYAWTLKLHAGRDAEFLDRDADGLVVASIYAFFAGADRAHYLRRDGAWLDLSHAAPGWSAGVVARDQLESPMRTTATWYLTGHDPVVVHNDQAAPVRVHEVGAWGVVRLPRLPYRLEVHLWRAGAGLGSDTTYTRMSTALGGAIAIGSHLALATQAGWGRLTGAALPQEALYLGGPTLYSVRENTLQGTGRALGRAELLLSDPLQSLLGLQARPLFPLQLGAFVGTGARWGYDPVTGLAQLTARDWPERAAWMSETGVSVLYRPGIPDPDSFVRLAIAWPVGPGSHTTTTTITYTRALNLLHAH